MRKELIFNNRHNDYSINKYYFQKDKRKNININKLDINKIFYLIKHLTKNKDLINVILDI